jgi:hypothetical protein
VALVPSIDVLGDGEDRDQHEVLVHHADAGGHRVPGRRRSPVAVDEDLALVGLVEPVEHVHQRALAGTVLAEQGVDLAGSTTRSIESLATGAEALRDARSSSFTGPPPVGSP